MQTTFTYNSVLVKDVCTEVWDLTSEKESTGVDQIGIRGQLVLTGIVHSGQKADPLLRPGSKDHTGVRLDNFREELFGLLKKLTKDRRKFVFAMGGKTIFSVAPGALEADNPLVVSQNKATILDKMDIDNGPKVSVQVTKVIGGVSAYVRFTINFLLPNCGGPESPGDPSGLVNFRFWIHEDIDCRTWLTTRTYSGKIRVAHKNISVHALRHVTVPNLEDGFQRQIVNWDESGDGLTLDFTIQDVERIAAAPWNSEGKFGAIDWDGSLTVSTGNTFGFTGMIDFRLRLTGPKTTSKADLIKIGFMVAESKARLFEAASAVKVNGVVIMLESLAVTEHFADNTIEVQAQIRHTGGKIIDGILSVGKDQLLGKPMGELGMKYDPEKNFAHGQTAGISGVFMSLLQTPCKPNRMPLIKVNASNVQNNETKNVPAAKGQTQSYTDLPVDNSAMSVAQLNNMYLEYLLTSRISANSGKIALPTGGGLYSSDPYIAIVNLHRPTSIRHIDIDATRLNSAPQLPDPTKSFLDANGIRHTLIDSADFEAQAPQISADNRKLVFRSQAHLTYAMSRAPQSGESLPVGCVPYRTSNPSDPARVIPASSFVDPSTLLR